ncbi:hypothetical protein [uncultured Treponema sp.]|nr:hypothetical protein [uncultured Treponema sp.]
MNKRKLSFLEEVSDSVIQPDDYSGYDSAVAVFGQTSNIKIHLEL